MILGMSFTTFTLLHVVISFIGIFSGIIVVYGMLNRQAYSNLTTVFLLSTILTSITGFLFPIGTLTPAHIVGILSLIVLALALLALYGMQLRGAWRWIYIVSAVAALYLNVFVSVVQAFQKLAFLQVLAPTQSEPPFVVAQSVVLAAFAVIGFLALRVYRPLTPTMANL